MSTLNHSYLPDKHVEISHSFRRCSTMLALDMFILLELYSHRCIFTTIIIIYNYIILLWMEEILHQLVDGLSH